MGCLVLLCAWHTWLHLAMPCHRLWLHPEKNTYAPVSSISRFLWLLSVGWVCCQGLCCSSYLQLGFQSCLPLFWLCRLWFFRRPCQHWLQGLFPFHSSISFLSFAPVYSHYFFRFAIVGGFPLFKLCCWGFCSTSVCCQYWRQWIFHWGFRLVPWLSPLLVSWLLLWCLLLLCPVLVCSSQWIQLVF